MAFRKRVGWTQVVGIAVAAIVAGATIAQAIREHSLAPVWSVGWLPAVLLACVASPASGRCSMRVRRRSRS